MYAIGTIKDALWVFQQCFYSDWSKYIRNKIYYIPISGLQTSPNFSYFFQCKKSKLSNSFLYVHYHFHQQIFWKSPVLLFFQPQNCEFCSLKKNPKISHTRFCIAPTHLCCHAFMIAFRRWYAMCIRASNHSYKAVYCYVYCAHLQIFFFLLLLL